ncbi:MAG TPA: glycosyltransferase family 1 protein [Thermoanaerobaculia bacterium]|nr:glycosyltransferase family 1 protein [Thermoanaerobaculia bacterium]
MKKSKPGVGLVSPSAADSWLGGHYIVQSLFLAAHSIPAAERLRFRDVWWGAFPDTDPFAEVRPLLGDPAVVTMPASAAARAQRFITRRVKGSAGAADLFHRAGIDVFFPVEPIDHAGLPLLFFVPDLQYRHLAHVNDERAVEYFDSYFRKHTAKAARIYVSSESVMRDVETFLPELAPKTRVVFPCSIPTPSWWDRDPATVAAQYGLPERYLAIPNQVSAHKNHLTIARALRVLRDRRIDAFIVCTGRNADYRDPSHFERLSADITNLGISDRIRFLGVLPRADQMALLRNAMAIVQPSEFEGWGAAVAEAKAIGKPLLASDLPVHHEHHHPRATWVETHDVDAWANAIERAWRALLPGPDAVAEEEARARTKAESVEVGRKFTALLCETVECRP